MEGGVNHIGLDHQIFVNELCRVSVIGINTANFGRSHVNLVWLFGSKKRTHSRLVGQVQFLAGAGDDIYPSPLT